MSVGTTLYLQLVQNIETVAPLPHVPQQLRRQDQQERPVSIHLTLPLMNVDTFFQEEEDLSGFNTVAKIHVPDDVTGLGLQ